MRYAIFLLILAFPILLTAQKAAIFHIDSLPTSGLTLIKGWRFQVGDDPNYAKTAFVDTAWKRINPGLDFHFLPPILPLNGDIIWFRLHFSVDSAISEPLLMMLHQAGASEMYLNDTLIHRFGVLSTNLHEIKAFSPKIAPISFPFQPKRENVLAVRYAFQPHIYYSMFFGNFNNIFRMEVNSVKNTVRTYHEKHVFYDRDRAFKIGIFSTLGVLYFVFFLFYPAQKINLYFSVYTILFACSTAIFDFHAHQTNPAIWYWLYAAIVILNFIAFMSLLTGIYRLFGQAISRFYKFVLFVGLIGFPCTVYFYLWGWMIPMMLFVNLVFVDIIRISLKAVRKQKKGAWIIAAASISSLLFWMVNCLQVLGILGFTYFDEFQALAVLCLPLFIAIYVGYDSALINRSLQDKLAEVENLSIEKQQMLISQTEMLEKQVAERTEALTQSLSDLQKAQAQLIQIETQQNLEKERTRLARDMHDDISSGLSAINLLANYIKDTPLSTDTHLEIQHIAEASTDINQRIREIIWAVSSDSDTLEGLAHFLRRYVSEFGEMQHIDTQFIAPDTLPDLKLSNEVKRNLFLCVKEGLNNTAKYAKATLIEVSIDVKGNETTLTIKDNGIGFDVENALKNGGNGLKNMRERMVQIGGEAIFLNGKGSEIVLRCKI